MASSLPKSCGNIVPSPRLLSTLWLAVLHLHYCHLTACYKSSTIGVLGALRILFFVFPCSNLAKLKTVRDHCSCSNEKRVNKKAESMFVQAEKDYIDLLSKRTIVEVSHYSHLV